MHPNTRLATLMGSASLLTIANSISIHAQQMAQAAPETIPEQVLVTGSLIHGTSAVGVPVTNLGVQDLTQSGNTTISDLFRTVPSAVVEPGPSAVESGGNQERNIEVNIRGLDATGPRSLMMIDGVRFPPQADGLCVIDPSIIPELAVDRVDVLADGASATYGSDAIAGVINIVLKRGFDGATTLLHYGQPTDGGGQTYQASQLWGRTWDGGDITITYEYQDNEPVKGKEHSNFTVTYNPWGLENPNVPIGAAIPGVISIGPPNVVSPVPQNSFAPVPNLVNGTCTNCFSIPRGTGANFSASGTPDVLNWSQLTSMASAAGDNNYVDPLQAGWELAAQQRNSFVLTADQRLFPGVSFFATGFYSNRRVVEKAPSFGGQGLGNYLQTWSVPTINPYYPVGAPDGLMVSYDLAAEVPPVVPAWDISERYQFGLNIDLPYAWTGQIYDSRSYEDTGFYRHFISKAGVNSALGNDGAQATNPATGAPIPFLNLFCDPHAFQCNSPDTLAYISATSSIQARTSIEEKGARFDGPLFDIPAGQIKAAIGALYDGDNVVGGSGSNQGSPGNGPIGQQMTFDPEPYHIWAEFAQVDVPVFGDNFNFPLMRRLDLEGSIRHDAYAGNINLTGETTNPKFAFTWVVDQLVGATVRGSWGSSFRFANEGEFSSILSPIDQSANLPGSGQNLTLQCTNGVAPAGSAAATLVAAGLACGSQPGGIGYGGGPTAVMRQFVNAATGQTEFREGGLSLAPEKALNYTIGLELAPTIDFLKGFDLQTTYYSVKVNGVLGGFLGNQDSASFADPTQRFHFIVPSDLGCPVAANANPTTCAPFVKMVTAAIMDPNNDIGGDLTQVSNVFWMNDTGTTNSGFIHVQGIDWSASYDYDAGDFGAWNIGMTGTYYLHRWSQTVAGGPVIDEYSQDIGPLGGLAQAGVETSPRLIYRTRLGWSDGPFSATLFYNFRSHFYETREGTPPNVNFQCTASGGTVGGGTFPCAINNYSQVEPDFSTFDLSFGYNTGMIPTNTYLRNLTLQLTVQNVLGKHASFEYGPTSATRNPAGYDITIPNIGRVVGVTLIKNW
ncbi:MAG TPA: TonB-dependent receptor plug domain-containing protein [Micropepsaceae bacterium]|nr:TonB-dependent receptor plug domain-containing protein [Micropepsaceae bacterium]